MNTPDWATQLRDAAGTLHELLITEPKHESLRIIHDDLGRALKAWDAAIAAENEREAEAAQQAQTTQPAA